METKQVQNFNSNKVNVSLNERNSSAFVFALHEIERKLSNSSQNQNPIKSYQPNLNSEKNPNRLLFRKVQNVNSTTSICDMIKFQRPQRRKLYLKRFYGCKRPISMRDFFYNKNDAIKGHPYEINSIGNKFK